jgi:hypothetical protein
MTAGRISISDNKEWCTPQKYADVIHSFFDNQLDLDPCSNKYSHIQSKVKYYLPEIDGLSASWQFHRIYVNPPFGRDKNRKTSIHAWIRKCQESHNLYNSEVLALIPVATNTTYWRKHIWNFASNICFLFDTRLKFCLNGKIQKRCPNGLLFCLLGKDYR